VEDEEGSADGVGVVKDGWHIGIAPIDRSKTTYGIVCARCNTLRTAKTIEEAIALPCPKCHLSTSRLRLT
jgi:hypothetical protein